MGDDLQPAGKQTGLLEHLRWFKRDEGAGPYRDDVKFIEEDHAKLEASEIWLSHACFAPMPRRFRVRFTARPRRPRLGEFTLRLELSKLQERNRYQSVERFKRRPLASTVYIRPASLSDGIVEMGMTITNYGSAKASAFE